MDIISKNTLLNLMENCEGLATSIFMPTYIALPEARQNPIRLKNLVSRAREQLQVMGIGERDISAYLAPIEDLMEDETFWQDQNEGLALFLDAQQLKIFRLPKRFKEQVIVSDEFYLKPLIPIYKGSGEYFLLSLDLKSPKLYRGSKFTLESVEAIDLPESLQEMFEQFYEFHSHLSFHTKTSTPNPDLAGTRQGQHFGHGGDDIDEKAEIRNFFHRFDEALMDYLNGEDIPLVLAGVGYLHPLYREANTYPNLLDQGFTKDVDQMPIKDLHAETWALVKDQYQTDLEQALGIYRSLADKNTSTTEALDQIVPAAYFKRVNTLFVADDAQVWGSFDPDTNKVQIENEKKPQNKDLLNFATAHTLRNAGNVFVISSEKVPGRTKAAAILRY